MALNRHQLETYEEKLFIFRQGADITLVTISALVVSVLLLVGTIVVAAPPAILTGYSITVAAMGDIDPWAAIAAGISFGLAVEAVGMVSAYVSLKLYQARKLQQENLDVEFVTSLGLILVYVAGVVVSMLMIEGFSTTLKGIGVASPLLAISLYIGRGLYLEHIDREVKIRLEAKESREEARKAREETRAHKRRMEEVAAQLAHEQRLAEIQAGKSAGDLPEGHRQNGNPSGNLPQWLPVVPDNLDEFRTLVDQGDIILPPGLTGSDLQENIPSVRTDRTGRNWLQAVNYRNGA